ncbi:hypothetical protein Tco_0484604 [Tanacetum coccineum]
MLAIDRVGFDWSDMAEEQVQTNMALMAFSDSEVYTDKSCSETCLKNYETVKKYCDDLIVKLSISEFKTATYKKGLATLEDQLVTYKKNEVLFCEEIGVLKREVGCKEYELSVLRNELEKVKKEKESLDEFKDPESNKYGPRDTVLESTIDCDKESDNSKKNTDDSLEKELVSDNKNSSIESSPSVVKETVFHAAKKVEFVEPKNNEKPVKRTVRYDEMYRSQSPRGNQRNWNGQKSNKLGYVRDAAGMFESIRKIELTASCYCDLKEYERAAIDLQIIKPIKSIVTSLCVTSNDDIIVGCFDGMIRKIDMRTRRQRQSGDVILNMYEGHQCEVSITS